MNVLKKIPRYHMLIVVSSMQEFQFSDQSLLESFSFFDIQKCYPGINREDFFMGEDCTWPNVLERLEEYQLLANIKAFELNLHYCNAFKGQLESYNSDLDCVNFYDNCLKRKEIEHEVKVIQDLNSKVYWKELESDQLLELAVKPSLKENLKRLRQEPRLMLA